jgi:L-lactate dehydrogenase complex protein LldG
VKFEAYFENLVEKAHQPFLQTAIVRARTHYLNRKNENLQKLENIQKWVEELKEIRRATLDKIPELLEQAKEAMTERGMHVYEARTGEEANRLILDLCESWDAKLMVKAKSITSEEIGMNEHLQKCGIEVWETDVGALLLQIMHGKAMHPTGVSIAVPKEVAATHFSKLAGKELPPDPPVLVEFVREFVREKVLKADVGFSGANAITADTGSIYLVTNEGNGRLVTSIPPRHIVLAGIDKVTPSRDVADLYVRVMPVYTTGAKSIIYLSVIGGLSVSSDIERRTVKPASGPKEIHVILLDNGRRALLRDKDFREILTCVKCGACLMECPIWNVVAGYYGEHVYMGGFGTILTAFTKSFEAAAAQAFTCTLCGKCKELCPMEVDVPGMIRRLRQKIVEKKIAVPHERILANALRAFNPYGEPPEKRLEWMKVSEEV